MFKMVTEFGIRKLDHQDYKCMNACLKKNDFHFISKVMLQRLSSGSLKLSDCNMNLLFRL